MSLDNKKILSFIAKITPIVILLSPITTKAILNIILMNGKKQLNKNYEEIKRVSGLIAEEDNKAKEEKRKAIINTRLEALKNFKG